MNKKLLCSILTAAMIITGIPFPAVPVSAEEVTEEVLENDVEDVDTYFDEAENDNKDVTTDPAANGDGENSILPEGTIMPQGEGTKASGESYQIAFDIEHAKVVLKSGAYAGDPVYADELYKFAPDEENKAFEFEVWLEEGYLLAEDKISFMPDYNAEETIRIDAVGFEERDNDKIYTYKINAEQFTSENPLIIVKAHPAGRYMLRIREAVKDDLYVDDSCYSLAFYSKDKNGKYSEEYTVAFANGQISLSEQGPTAGIVINDTRDFVAYEVQISGQETPVNATEIEGEKVFLLENINSDTEVVVKAGLQSVSDYSYNKIVINCGDEKGKENLFYATVRKDTRFFNYSNLGYKSMNEDGTDITSLKEFDGMPAGSANAVIIEPGKNVLIKKVTVAYGANAPEEISAPYDFDVSFGDGEKGTTAVVNVTTAKAYTVQFDSNGGTSVKEQMLEIADGASYAVKPEDPIKVGYDFAGWFDGAEEVEWTQNKCQITEDKVFKAKWETAQYKTATVKVSQQPADGEWAIESIRCFTSVYDKKKPEGIPDKVELNYKQNSTSYCTIEVRSTKKAADTLPVFIYKTPLNPAGRIIAVTTSRADMCTYKIPVAELVDNATFRLTETEDTKRAFKVTNRLTGNADIDWTLAFTHNISATYGSISLEGNVIRKNTTLERKEDPYGFLLDINQAMPANKYFVMLTVKMRGNLKNAAVYPILTKKDAKTGTATTLVAASASSVGYTYKLSVEDIAEGDEYIFTDDTVAGKADYKVSFDSPNAKIIPIQVGSTEAPEEQKTAGIKEMTVGNSDIFTFKVEAPENYTTRSVKLNRGSVGYRNVVLRSKTDKSTGEVTYTLQRRNLKEDICPGPVTITVVCEPTQIHTMTFQGENGITLSDLLITTNDGGILTPDSNGVVTFIDNQRVFVKVLKDPGAKNGVKCCYKVYDSDDKYQLEGLEQDMVEIDGQGRYVFDLGRNYSSKEYVIRIGAKYNVTFDVMNATVYDLGYSELQGTYTYIAGDVINFFVETDESYILDSVNSTGTLKYIAKDSEGEDLDTPYYSLAPAKDTMITVKAHERKYYNLEVLFTGDYADAVKSHTQIEYYAGNTAFYGEEGVDLEEIGIPEDENRIVGISFSPDGRFKDYKVSVNGQNIVKKTVTNPDDNKDKKDVFFLGKITQDARVVIQGILDPDKSYSIDFLQGDYTAEINPEDVNSKKTVLSGSMYCFLEREAVETIKITPVAGYEIKKITVNDEILEGGTDTFTLPAEYEDENGGSSPLYKWTIRVDTEIIKGSSAEEQQITVNNTSVNLTYEVLDDTSAKLLPNEGTSHTYSIGKNFNSITLKISAGAGYEPEVKLGSSVLTGTKGAVSGGRTEYRFVVAKSLVEGDDKVVTINEKIICKAVTINYNPDEVEVVSAVIGSKQAAPVDKTLGALSYDVPLNESIMLTVKNQYNCVIKSAESKIGNAAAKKVSVKNTGGDLTVKATDDTVITVASEGLYLKRVLLNTTDGGAKEGETVSPVKDTFTVNTGNTYVMGAIKGASASVPFRRAEVKGGSSIVAIGRDNTRPEIWISDEDAGKTLTVNLYEAESGLLVVTYKLSVAQNIKFVKVAGAKAVSGVQTLSHVAGFRAEYKLTMNPTKADASILEAEVCADENGARFTTGNPPITAGIADGKLVIEETGEAGNLKEAYIIFTNKDTEETVPIGVATNEGFMKVNIAANSVLEKATPTLKLVSANEDSLTLNLGVPKSIVWPTNGKLYYLISATENTKEESDPECGEIPSGTYSMDIVMDDLVEGEEETKISHKFNTKVQIVQVYSSDAAISVPGDLEGQISAGSKEKTLNNVSTIVRAAADAKTFSLKKKTTTVYTGQENVLAAEAVFGKTVTVRKLYMAKDVTEGLRDDEKLEVTPSKLTDDCRIIVSATEGTKVGVHMIKVTPCELDQNGNVNENAGNAGAAKTITVTVVQGIESLGFKTHATSVYKPAGKAATIKLAPLYNVNEGEGKAKTAKVRWSVINANYTPISASSPLYNMVTVKNGTVTINKKYAIPADGRNCKFRVKIVADDFAGNSVEKVSEPIAITSAPIEIGHAVIVKKNAGNFKVVSLAEELTQADLSGAKVITFRKGMEEKTVYTQDDLDQYEIPSDCLTYKTSAGKKLAVEADGAIKIPEPFVQKKITITITTADGGKKSTSITGLNVTK